MKPLRNGQVCEIMNTNSDIDGTIVDIVGRVTNFGMAGDIYIIKKRYGDYFTINGELWECMVLTNACLKIEEHDK